MTTAAGGPEILDTCNSNRNANVMEIQIPGKHTYAWNRERGLVPNQEEYDSHHGRNTHAGQMQMPKTRSEKPPRRI